MIYYKFFINRGDDRVRVCCYDNRAPVSLSCSDCKVQ